MDHHEKQKKQGLSRRGFLTVAALSAAGLASLGMLGGCADGSSGSTGGAAPEANVDTSNVQAQDIEIIETEMLLLGLGNAGLAAAWQAIKEGRQITVVDKAQFKHGGPSGWSWDCYSFMANPTFEQDSSQGMANQQLWKNAVDYFNKVFDPNEVDNTVYQVNHGQTLCNRDETGKITNMMGIYFGQYFRREMDEMQKRSNVTVYDQTMITEVFINDGVCLGAMGIHVPSGKFRIFRAKATLMAVGAPVWMYGWVNTKPVSLGSADNTGELTASCYRNGMSIGESEFGSYDFWNTYPRVGFLVSTGADAATAVSMIDKDGELIFPDGPGMGGFNMQNGIARAVAEGRGGPDGEVYIRVGESRDHMYTWNEIVSFRKKYYEDDLADMWLPVYPEQFEKGGTPVVDENLMTEVAGLFDVRGAGTATIRQGFNSLILKIYGAYAGYTVAQYIKNTADYPTEIDWQPALDEYVRLHSIRTKEVEDGIRPLTIREVIQKKTYEFDGLWREKEKIESAIAEFERIREEDLPRMICADKTVNWNREWKDAIETLNLLDCAEMTARATLFREESGRNAYIRPDFPELDDENWKCMVICKNVDGTMAVEKREINPA